MEGGMEEVTDDDIVRALEVILVEVDMETTSVRSVMRTLMEQFPNSSLESRKSFVKEQILRIMEVVEELKEQQQKEELVLKKEEDVLDENGFDEDIAIEEIEEEEEEGGDGDDGEDGEQYVEEEDEDDAFSGKTRRKRSPAFEREFEDDDDDFNLGQSEEPRPKRKRPRASANAASSGEPRTRKLSAFEKAVVLKDNLADALGIRIVSRCKIPQYVKMYIQNNDLQKNPRDKREYLADEILQRVLKTKSFSMFSINRYMVPLIIKADECDEKTQQEAREYEEALLETKRLEGDFESPKPRKKKTKSRSRAQVDGAGSRNTGLSKPMRLSSEMAEICKQDVLPRTEVVKKIWEYIRENDLKDPADGRRVICDAKMRKIFNGEKAIGIFAMNKHIGRHLTSLEG